MQRKEEALETLRQSLSKLSAGNVEGRMNLYEALWQENRSYNTDSSLFYATALSQLAQQAGNEEQKQNALLHRATALMTIGMFKEASSRGSVASSSTSAEASSASWRTMP